VVDAIISASADDNGKKKMEIKEEETEIIEIRQEGS
jgi:hypothetical protein